MFIFILLIHVIISILLIIIILMQSGRGGGLTETFSGMESIFGTKTNVILVRTTTVLAILFLFTCLSLAFLSKAKGKSLIQEQVVPIKQTKTAPIAKEETKTQNKIEEVTQGIPEEASTVLEQKIKENIENPEESTNQQ